jgi:hypothetical protein
MLLPALLLLACGCASVGSRTWNLEQLHAEDSSYKYTGALMGDLEYLLRQQLFGPSVLFQSGLARKDPSAIEDPSGETLDALIGLMELSPSDRLTRARQIQWFARLAVEDPSALCRERAFLGLAFAAAGLAPIEPQAAPKASERTGELALPPLKAQKDRGSTSSSRAKAARPRPSTGSCNRSGKVQIIPPHQSGASTHRQRVHRLARCNRPPPISKPINTGDQADRIGARSPFTPMELKLKATR